MNASLVEYLWCFAYVYKLKPRRWPILLCHLQAQEWSLAQMPQGADTSSEPHCEPPCLTVSIRDTAGGQCLGCDPATGYVALSGQPGPCHPFRMTVDESSGDFTLSWAPSLESSLLLTVVTDPRSPALVCSQQEQATPAVFRPSKMLRLLAYRYLRLAIVTRSADLAQPGFRECSIAAYDTSPEASSYACYVRQDLGRQWDVSSDLLYLEQEALLFQDRSRYLAPRVPLSQGRLRCENEDPDAIALCTFAYGEGLTFIRVLTVNWNYLIFDTATVRLNAQAAVSVVERYGGSGGGGGGGTPAGIAEGAGAIGGEQGQTENPAGGEAAGTGAGGAGPGEPGAGEEQDTSNQLVQSVTGTKEFQNDFTVAYLNIFERVVIQSYIETRNWQMTLTVPPNTVHQEQFWLEVMYLRYRWRALFNARGGWVGR
jgi:hypothetical protein